MAQRLWAGRLLRHRKAQLLLVNLLTFGLEVCLAAGITYVPPLLLEVGVEEKFMTMVLGESPHPPSLLLQGHDTQEAGPQCLCPKRERWLPPFLSPWSRRVGTAGRRGRGGLGRGGGGAQQEKSTGPVRGHRHTPDPCTMPGAWETLLFTFVWPVLISVCYSFNPCNSLWGPPSHRRGPGGR